VTLPAFSTNAAMNVATPVHLEKQGRHVFLAGDVTLDEHGHPRAATELFTAPGRRLEPSQKWIWFSGNRKLELGACGVQQPVRFHADGSYESGCWLVRDEEFSINGQSLTIRGVRDFHERLADTDVIPYLVMHANGLPAQAVLAKAASFSQDGWTTQLPTGSNLALFANGRLAEAYVDSLPIANWEGNSTHTGLVTLFENGRPHIIDMIRVPSGDDPKVLADFQMIERRISLGGQRITAVQLLEYDAQGRIRSLVSKDEITLPSAEGAHAPLTVSPFTIICLDPRGRIEATRACDQSFAPSARCSLEIRKDSRLQFGWNVWQRRWSALTPN
jgi:hypothetical protein